MKTRTTRTGNRSSGSVKLQPAHLIVGEIGKPHGIKGELFVMPATDNVAAVYERGRSFRLGDSDASPMEPEVLIEVAGVREFKGGLLVRFTGIGDRNAAENIRGRTLLLPRDEVQPLEDEEFFLHDLIDLEVRSLDGAVIGRVREIYTVGSGHLLSVDDGERERMIPFSRQLVREVDLEDGRIVIEPLPGLLEL